MRGYAFIVLVGLALASCKADPMVSGPDDSTLKARLSTELPAFIRLRDLRVEASSNVGDRVEPLFKTRFTATIELTTDTFTQTSVEEGAVIIALLLKKGTTRELYGLAQSSLFAGAWKTVFTYENDPLPGLGRPRDLFGGGVVLVRGSAEEATFREDVRKRRAEAEQQQLDASRREVERIRTESQMETGRLRAAAEAQAERRRVEEQLQADQRREAEQRDEVRLRAWIAPQSSFNGKYDGRIDIRILFDSVATAQRSLSGQANWDSAAVGSLPTTYRFQGRWSGGTISATGTETIEWGQQGDQPAKNEVRTCTLTLTAEPSGRLEGTLCGRRVSFTR